MSAYICTVKINLPVLNGVPDKCHLQIKSPPHCVSLNYSNFNALLVHN